LGPFGVRLFSVGDSGALLAGAGDEVVVVVVVVVLVVVGAWLPLVPQAVVNAPIAMSKAPPATASRRRSTLRACTCYSHRFCLAQWVLRQPVSAPPALPLVVVVNPRRFRWCRRRRYLGCEQVGPVRAQGLLGWRLRCTAGRRSRGGRRGRGCRAGGRWRLVTTGAAGCGQRTHRNEYSPTRHSQSPTTDATCIHVHSDLRVKLPSQKN